MSMRKPEPTSKSGGTSVSSEYRKVDRAIKLCGNSKAAGIGLSSENGAQMVKPAVVKLLTKPRIVARTSLSPEMKIAITGMRSVTKR